MDEQTVVAAPSAAPETTTPSLDIPRSGTPEYTKWRIDGTLPDKTQPRSADTATADPSKETTSEANAENAGEPETPKPTQEHNRRKPDAEQRIAQLVSENKRIKDELEAYRAPKPAAEAPRQTAPQPQYTRPKPTAEDKAQDGSPKYSTYEDFVEELADWKAEQRWVGAQREAVAHAQAKELETKVADAHARYGDAFDASRDAFTKATMGPHGEPLIPVGILSMVSDSDILTDLVHRIGSDPDDLASFVSMAKANPRQAILHIAAVESAIKAEFGQDAGGNRNERGQFVKTKPETPAKRGPESTPEPPLEISNRGSGPLDESERALKEIERGNPTAIRAWMKAENAKDLRRRKGL